MSGNAQATKRWTTEEKQQLCYLVDDQLQSSTRIQWLAIANQLHVTVNQAKRQYNNMKARHPDFANKFTSSHSRISIIEGADQSLSRQSSLQAFKTWSKENEQTLELCIRSFGPNTQSIAQFFPNCERQFLQAKIMEQQRLQEGFLIFDKDNFQEESESVDIVKQDNFDM